MNADLGHIIDPVASQRIKNLRFDWTFHVQSGENASFARTRIQSDLLVSFQFSCDLGFDSPLAGGAYLFGSFV